MARNLKIYILAASVLMTSAALFSGDKKQGLEIFPKGIKAPTQFFTKTAWLHMVYQDEKGALATQVYNVTFEKAARTNWHSHPGGQILIASKGIGYHQIKGQKSQILKPGDVIAVPPDTIHWHGASQEGEFVHLGMSTQTAKGPVHWLAPVSDEEYRDAIAKGEK